MKTKHKLLLSASVALAFAVFACGGDDNGDDGNTDDGDVVDVVGGATGSGGSTSNPGDGTGGTTIEEPDRPACPDTPNSSLDGEECWDLSACNGSKEQQEQFLNQCNSGQCFPFNNAEWIPTPL